MANNNFCALVLCQTIVCCVFMMSTCLFLEMYQFIYMLCKLLCILSIFVYSYNQYISSYLVRKNMYSSKHKFVNYMFRHFDLDGETDHGTAQQLGYICCRILGYTQQCCTKHLRNRNP